MGRNETVITGKVQPHPEGPRCPVGAPLFAERYQAITAQDPRFDGQFYTAVSSTGLYCRASCPARTPKASNVTFYLTSAAAQEAGFRACRCCRPEAAAGTPLWDSRQDLVGRAMRLIVDGFVDREGVDALAGRLGESVPHVHRTLVSELGAGTLALARGHRAQLAYLLLLSSDLPVVQVAFAAGFGSVRQCNDTIQEIFAARPTDLRLQFRSAGVWAQPAAGQPETVGAGAPVGFDVDLPVRQPFDALGIFRFLAARTVPGVEVTDISREDRLRYARTLALPHGPGAVEVVARRGDDSTWRLQAHLELTSVVDTAPAMARVRRMLDLDADPIAVDAALSADPVLAPLVADAPGMRVPGAVDPHELVIRALIGQQISVAAARAHLGRLVARSGLPYVSAFPELTRLFPTAGQIVAAVPEPAADQPLDPHRPLRLPRAAIVAVRGVAGALAAGDLAIDVGTDGEQLRAQLLSRPRIGPWSAAYITMRVLGDPDTWLNGDVALLTSAKALGLIGQEVPKAAAHRLLATRATAWAPWRSYAVLHLWGATGGAPPGNRAR